MYLSLSLSLFIYMCIYIYIYIYTHTHIYPAKRSAMSVLKYCWMYLRLRVLPTSVGAINSNDIKHSDNNKLKNK